MQRVNPIWILSLLFLISPLYSQVNIGGSGLALTYNIPVWASASWLMGLALLHITNTRKFTYPSLWLFFISFPVIIIVTSVLGTVDQPITWLFRLLYILGGLAFLLSLFQFNISPSQLDKILYIIVIASGIHALIGVAQIHTPELALLWVSNPAGLVPRGIFQQINVHISFLSTGLIISLYLISRPSFRTRSTIVKLSLLFIFPVALYIIMASGSRIGLLSIALSLPLVFWSRYTQLRHHKKFLAILFLVSCCAIFAGKAGIEKTVDKSVQLSDASYSTARVAMYTIGLELVAKEPVSGYGTGGFLKAWNLQASDFIQRHPETVLPPYVTHPHNELLFWMIEGGLPSVLGIVIVIIGIGIALVRCGFQRGGAYAAMLLPISLHTQVELPFYISALHWFLWLFLIYLALSHATKMVVINLSAAASKSLQVVACLFAILVTVFMFNTARAQADLYDFLYNKSPKQPYLQLALNNLYFKPAAEQVAMRSMLYVSIENNDREKVQGFVDWAERYVAHSPELKMYEDLISASLYLKPEGNGCDAIHSGLAMYAHNKPLQEAAEQRCATK